MDKFLSERKRDLLLEKNKIDRELKEIAVKKNGKYRVVFPDFGQSTEDNAVEVDTYEKMLSLKRDLSALQKDVELGLQKIKNDAYGVCEKCHRKIDVRRLRVYPEARYCVKCATVK